MHRISVLAACLSMLVATEAAAVRPTFTDLGIDNAVQAVSDDGSVVVGLALNYTDPAAVGVTRWTTQTGTRRIGGLTAGRPDVSADGATIAGTIETDRPQAAFWTDAGGWKPLDQFELIPPMPGWHTTSNVISSSGQRLGGGTIPPPVDYGHVRGFSFNPDTYEDRWADYGWQELPLARKGSVAEVSGISNDGLVQVGISSDIGGAFRAVRWTDGRISELLDPRGNRLGGESVRCNGACDVVVGGGGGSSAVRPVLAWRILAGVRAPACYLAPLSGPALPALRYYAYDTTNTGHIVVGSYFYTELPEGDGFSRTVAKGFIWIGDARGGTMHELGSYLARLGQHGLDGWLNVLATGISADGRYLVGWGDDPQGVSRGWRVAFTTSPLASGPAADRTTCPTVFSPKPRPDALVRSPTPEPDYRDLPSGEFRDGANRSYRVQMRGTRLYGASGKAALGELVALGGDRYYDPATRSWRTFERDRDGLVTRMSERRVGRTAVFQRRTSR